VIDAATHKASPTQHVVISVYCTNVVYNPAAVAPAATTATATIAATTAAVTAGVWRW